MALAKIQGTLMVEGAQKIDEQREHIQRLRRALVMLLAVKDAGLDMTDGHVLDAAEHEAWAYARAVLSQQM